MKTFETITAHINIEKLNERATTRKMPISDQEFMTDPKSPLKKAYL